MGIGKALLGLVSLIIVVLVGAYLYFSSRAGSERILHWVQSAANAALKGTVDVGQLAWHGSRVSISQIVLKDPDGKKVAEVASVDVQVTLGGLIHNTLILRQVRLVTPRLYLRTDDRGLNLTRAIEPRSPSESSGQPSSLRIVLENLELRDGYFSFEEEPHQASNRIELVDLGARGSVAVRPAQESLQADLQLDGRTTSPTKGPLSLKLRAALEKSRGTASVGLAATGLEVDASAELAGPRAQTLDLKRLTVSPAMARAFAAGYPLLTAVSVAGHATRAGDAISAQLDINAGKANVHTEASLDSATWKDTEIKIHAREINLRELLASQPSSNLSLDAEAHASGNSLSNLVARVTISAPPGRVAEYTTGPVHAKLTARSGRWELTELSASLPGVAVKGSGSGTTQRLSVNARVSATDIGAFTKSLPIAGGSFRLFGAGELNFSANGALSHPSIAVDGFFPRLRYQDNLIRNLNVAATIPDIRKPFEAQGSLNALELRLGSRSFGSVSAKLSTRRRAAEIDLSASGAADVLLHAGGTSDEDGNGILLSQLTLRYPEAEWSLVRPVHIRFLGSPISVESAELRSGAQSIRIEGRVQRNQISAALDIQRLDLGRLPKAFVDPSLNLAGSISAHISASGPASQPIVDAKIDLERGRFKEIDNASLALLVHYERDRANGKVTASAVDARLDADFDLPLQALLQRRRQPVRLRATLQEVDLEKILHAARRSEPWRGTAESKVEVTGTADNPRIDLSLTGKSFSYDRFPPVDFDFRLRSTQNGTLNADLKFDTQGSQSSIALRTPFTAAGLIQRLPSRKELLSAAFEAELSLHRFPLSVLRELNGPEDLRGTLSASATFRGTLTAPSGSLKADLEGLATGEMPAIDLALGANASSKGATLTAMVRRQEKEVLRVRASVNTPVNKIGSLEALAAVPFEVDASVGPLNIRELHALAMEEARTGQVITGTLHAQLTAKGTLMDPRIQLRSELESISFGKATLGSGNLAFDYAKPQAALKLELASANGRLHLDSKAQLDLSYPALRDGISYLSAPVQATLDADQFDLAFLSGATPQIRQLGGMLTAHGKLEGKLGAPALEGDVEWKDGRLSLLGFGDYQKIHLLVHGTLDRIELTELMAQSAGGTGTLKAEATRTGDRFALTGSTDFNKFPVIVDDQLVATATFRSTLEGEISPHVINVRKLEIPRALIELPEVKKKDLQKLDPPDDIIVLKRGTSRKSANAPTATSGTGRQVYIVVEAPRNLWVRSSDVNIELGLGQGFNIQIVNQPAIFGEVHVIRGRTDVLGRKFDIQRDSTIRFGGSPTQPYVNITAIHVNERENVKVYITVQGQGTNVTIKPSSDPPYSESEIYTLIATGHLTLKRGSGSSAFGTNQAASILGSLAATELRKSLSSKLPLDVLSIEAGEGGGLTGTKLEAGTYVSDKVYIGYAGRVGARPDRGENSNAARFEYQITPRWSLEAEYGDARAGSVDLIWSKDY